MTSQRNIPELNLDPNLKWWVLIPISFVMVLTGLLKQNIQVLINPAPKLEHFSKVRTEELFIKIQNFRSNCRVLSYGDFVAQREMLINTIEQHIIEANKEKEEKEKNKKEGEITNPFQEGNMADQISNMFKGNMANFIPQTIIMGWVNYFYNGLVIMKLPFPLTFSFKQMLQNGVNTNDLDASWVSSISWYFVNLLGLSSVSNLILRSNTGEPEMRVYNKPLLPQLDTPGAPSTEAFFKKEINGLHIIDHAFDLDGIEKRILTTYT